MTRAQIIADLLACLRAMGPEHGQSLAARAVVRGMALSPEGGELPMVCLFTEKVLTTELAEAFAQRIVVMHVWGAAKAPEGDFSQLDELCASVVGALCNPQLNPHWPTTSLGTIEFFEGGANEPVGMFDLVVEVGYEAAVGQL